MGLLSRALDSKWCWDFAALVCPAEKQNFRVNKALHPILIPSAKEQPNRLETAKMGEVCHFCRKTKVHHASPYFTTLQCQRAKKACHPPLKTPAHFSSLYPKTSSWVDQILYNFAGCITLCLLMEWI